MYKHTSFPNQKPDEHVLMFLRRHWFVPLKLVAMAVVLTVVPLIFYVIIYNFTDFLTNDATVAILVLLGSAYYLFAILYSFSSFIDYYLDVWLVTNQRIIDIEQKGLFARIISEEEIDRVINITSETKGFWATVLNYGDVYIETAVHKQRFAFRQIPFAEQVAQKISNMVSDYRKLKGTGNGGAV
ncbi:MAG: hypothetical protein V1763_02135 [Parcubacteria group bacterium]